MGREQWSKSGIAYGATAVRDERPTLVPGFDVPQLARDSDRWTRRESGVRAAVRLPTPQDDASVHVRAADVYWSRLGGPDAVPVLRVPLDRVPADQRARCEGFLLCRIDGVTPFSEIIASSTLPELTALSMACDLVDAGVVAFSPSGSR